MSYLESGYHSNLKNYLIGLSENIIQLKNLEATIKTYPEMFFIVDSQFSKYEIILKFTVIIPVISAFLALLIYYRNHFGLGKNPFDYISVILDCNSIFEIYILFKFLWIENDKDMIN